MLYNVFLVVVIMVAILLSDAVYSKL